MKKNLTLIILTVSLFLQAQTVYEKVELSFDYVDMRVDSITVATVKTYTNIDLYDGGYFLTWTSKSERVYHFMYPNTCGYDINRMTFKQTNIPLVYKCSFPLFSDSIAVNISNNRVVMFNKNYQSLIFYNK